MLRFAEFEFDPATGELLRGGRVERLAPQTALVLEILLERAGGIVSREELHRRIWPDATVEFDQGLNFCVRQLRIALGDDASAPKYIETLPRRGYRFVSPVVSDTPSADVMTGAPTGRPSKRHAMFAAVLLIGLVTLASVATFAARLKPPVLAIVPFDVNVSAPDLIDYRDRITEAIIDRTTARAARQLVIVGPSYTKQFRLRTPIDSIRSMIGAAYAVSGAVRRSGGGVDVFAQLVRANDRGHLWVIRVSDSSNHSGDIGTRIADSVTAILTSTRVRTPLGFEDRERRP